MFPGLLQWLVSLILPWLLFSSQSYSINDLSQIMSFISMAPISLWGKKKKDFTNGLQGSTRLSCWPHPLNLCSSHAHFTPATLTSLCSSSNSWGLFLCLKISFPHIYMAHSSPPSSLFLEVTAVWHILTLFKTIPFPYTSDHPTLLYFFLKPLALEHVIHFLIYSVYCLSPSTKISTPQGQVFLSGLYTYISQAPRRELDTEITFD